MNSNDFGFVSASFKDSSSRSAFAAFSFKDSCKSFRSTSTNAYPLLFEVGIGYSIIKKSSLEKLESLTSMDMSLIS